MINLAEFNLNVFSVFSVLANVNTEDDNVMNVHQVFSTTQNVLVSLILLNLLKFLSPNLNAHRT